MKYTFDLYGIRTDDLESVVDPLSVILRAPNEPRHGLNRGGDYYGFATDESETITLEFNFDAADREWRYPQYRDFGLLLFVEYPGSKTKYENALTKMQMVDAVLLRRSRYSENGKEREVLFTLPPTTAIEES